MNFVKVLKPNLTLPLISSVRNINYKFPMPTKSLKDRLEEKKVFNPLLDFKVDISLPPPPSNISKEEKKKRIMYLKKRKNNEILEAKASKLEIDFDLDEVRADWLKDEGPLHIKRVAEHFKIFDHLFGDAYFTPYVLMDIFYPQKNEELFAPVCWGNIVKPDEAFTKPEVKFKSDPNELWTLSLVCPDGHLTVENGEYIHWLVGNIPGNQVEKGEEIWDYLPPFPPRGVGFLRYIFILYKQEKKIDFSSLKNKMPRLELSDRNFKTLNFYREKQDELTPAGLSFFQSDWDKTSRKVFHEILNMEEPIFEYDHVPKTLKIQKPYPNKEPFNLYMDRYRHPQDLNKEYLIKKLKEIDPFKPPKKPFPYPKAILFNYRGMPSWLKIKEKRYQGGLGRVEDMDFDDYK